MQSPPQHDRSTPRFPIRTNKSSRNQFHPFPHLLLPRDLPLGADHLIRYVRVLRIRSTESLRRKVLYNHFAENVVSERTGGDGPSVKRRRSQRPELTSMRSGLTICGRLRYFARFFSSGIVISSNRSAYVARNTYQHEENEEQVEDEPGP